jgi:hypothetical protein
MRKLISRAAVTAVMASTVLATVGISAASAGPKWPACGALRLPGPG